MTALPQALAAGPKPSPSRNNAALVALFRLPFAERFGVRFARASAIGMALWFAKNAWLAAKGPDADGWTTDIAARGAAFIVAWAGSLGALFLVTKPKDSELEAGIRSLAEARGFSSRSIQAAEVAASIRLMSEIIALPTAALAFVCLILSREASLDAILPILGAAIFGGAAAIVLGAMAVACRHWGGARARTALLAATFLPWIVAGALLEGRGGEYISIPGLLGWAWRLLTGGQG